MVGLCIVVAHRADHLLDERDLTGGEPILRVEVLVRPLPRPVLRRHKGIDLACYVLGWLVQENQKTSQSTGEKDKTLSA